MTKAGVAPLWPMMRNVLPQREPKPLTKPGSWSFKDLRPLLLRADELIPVERPNAAYSCFPIPAEDLVQCKPQRPSILVCSRFSPAKRLRLMGIHLPPSELLLKAKVASPSLMVSGQRPKNCTLGQGGCQTGRQTHRPCLESGRASQPSLQILPFGIRRSHLHWHASGRWCCCRWRSRAALATVNHKSGKTHQF